MMLKVQILKVVCLTSCFMPFISTHVHQVLYDSRSLVLDMVLALGMCTSTALFTAT